MPESKNHGKILLSWIFPEFIQHKRSKAWYFWAFVLGGGMLVFALLTANFLFALIIIIVAIILFLYHYKEPVEVEFKITEDGIGVGKKFYPYKELENFWLIYEPPEVKTLYFDFKSALKPRLSIPLVENQNPLKIRKILLLYLEEDIEKESEPASDTLGRMLKI